MMSLRLLLLAVCVCALLLQGKAATGDVLAPRPTSQLLSSSSTSSRTFSTVASPSTGTPVLATPAPHSSSAYAVSTTALPDSSVSATPPLPTSATAVPPPATAISFAPSSATCVESISPSATEFPESSVPVTPPFPAYEDSNATDTDNGTFPAESHNKQSIWSSHALIGLVVVVTLFGCVGVAVVVVCAVWKLPRGRMRTYNFSDKSQLVYTCHHRSTDL